MVRHHDERINNLLPGNGGSWQQEHFQILLQYSNDAIVLLTEAGDITYASPPIQTVLGYQQADTAEAEAAQQRFYNLLMQAPAVICLLRGPQHIYEMANPLYQQITGQRDLLG